jgi:hypothetical protein
MVNEDIITALRNAVSKGEPLDHAIGVMIQSGYNPDEVHEASRYVSSGVTPMLEPKPQEQLTMPQEKHWWNIVRKNPLPQNSFSKPSQPSNALPAPQPEFKNIPSQPVTVTEKPVIKTKSYTKEIILLIILLILIGVLIATILFRDNILGFFSG